MSSVYLQRGDVSREIECFVCLELFGANPAYGHMTQDSKGNSSGLAHWVHEKCFKPEFLLDVECGMCRSKIVLVESADLTLQTADLFYTFQKVDQIAARELLSKMDSSLNQKLAKKAVQEGDVPFLKWLDEERNISFNYSLIECAFLKKQKEVVAFLLEKTSLSPNQRKNVWSSLAHLGWVDLLEALFEKKPPSIKARGEILGTAAANRQIAVIRFLKAYILRQPQEPAFLPEDLSGAVIEAAKNGFLDVLQEIFPDERLISDVGLGTAVQRAAEAGHAEIVKYLVPKERTILASFFKEAFLAAAERGAEEIVYWFLEGAHEIDEVLRREAGAKAKKGGHVELVRVLYRQEKRRKTQSQNG